MKRLFALLMIVVGTTAYGGTLNADACCPCPSMDWCCGEFCVDAELLIWRAMDCPDDYAMILATTPTIPPGNVNQIFTSTPEFDLGFRVSARYDRDCWFVDGRYIWFQSSDINQVERDTDIILLQNFRRVQAVSRGSNRFRYGYQDANIRVGMQCLGNRCFQLYSWLEGRYAHIKSKRTTAGLNAANTFDVSLRAASSFDGGGLGLGFGVQAQALSCLHVSAELAAVGLVGSQNGHFTVDNRATNPDQVQVVNYRSKSNFIQGLDLRAKIAYVSCYRGIDFSLFFAWETNQYWDAQLLTEPDVGVETNINIGERQGNRQCSPLGFGGPSVGFTVCY